MNIISPDFARKLIVAQLRARGWTLWKATFELCQIEDKNSQTSRSQKTIISNILM